MMSFLLFLAGTVFLPLILAGNPVPTDPAEAHAIIAQYNGPQTCINCHPTEANDALNAEHMQWQGKWTQVNTYCTAPEPADYACRSCHASTGKVDNLTSKDVDCLVCHNNTYQRALGPQTIVVTVTDWQGNTKTYQTPEKIDGDYRMQPRYDLMPPGTTMTQLARTVTRPDRATCLRCHAKSGGSDGAKRGDISTADLNPSVTHDVHMSPQGANLLCQNCHTVSDHKIAGKGIDLHIEEGAAKVRCENCHTGPPHDSADLNQHAARVACQTCHIPTYGKDVSTELSRDWRSPVWNPAGCSGQGAWVGEEVRGSNVKPAYKFWNGQSQVYDLADPISPDPDGSYTMARALGTIQDGKLYPIKVHTAYQPRHDASGRIVQYDVLWNFMTGKFEEAAGRGVQFMGLGGPYTWVKTRAEQLITHGVEPKENALGCDSCHNGGPQMDLKTLGYTLKGSSSEVCTQCHGQESTPAFYKLHDKHVDSERKDCSWCHAFSRPERGLETP